ncbi:ATP-dependent transcriptional regulator [Brevibacillus choshinensis]|uniref:ATP-dependent transcriptional regulator n=1 Tax=Brevibacillus choshinensis TaxID=54911 RepID=A0ABR5NBS9_BRECH|nr:BTAD domain-containing putative transcriptional regulator [Brevibacillus choshinensis]KQL49006.1 ATP-dependent transcriptional regulator [Brevibacillus choshinensis]
MNTSQVSITKITPPRPKPYVLRRPSLAKKLRLLHHVPLCVVHAATGYGKTMTVAAYLHDTKLDACWYYLTEGDEQLSVFLYGLVESVRRLFPHFGGSIANKLEIFTGEEWHPQRMAELFVREWHQLQTEKDHLIVLDDYHYIEKDSPVDAFIRKLAGQLPHHLKLLILSRAQLTWPELELWKARGECLALKTEDLTFSREDSEAFFQDEYDVWLTAEEWDRVEQMSRGWVLSLRYLGEKMSGGATVSESLRDLARLVHFLEAEVWLRLDEQLQLFLMKCAVLEEFEEEDCRQILGEKGVELLSHIHQCNLFIAVDQQGKHSFHPLFHRLLASKLASNSELYLQVNEEAALWYRRKGEDGKAFEHLQLAEKWDVLGEWLCQASERLLTDGKLEVLYHWITLLPDSMKEAKHWLWFYQAEVERYRCHYIKAFGSYEHFLELCATKHDQVGQCRGLEGMARVHLDSVQGVRAETLLKQAIDLLPPAEQGQEMAPRLYRLLAEIYTNRGDAKQAAEWYRRSQELEQLTEVELESRLLFRTGRLQSSIQLLEEKSMAERSKHPKLTRSYRETSLLLSFVYALNGEWERGWQAAETAIELGRAANSPFVEANGYVRKAHAALISQQLPAEEIRQLYEKGLHMMEDLQSTRGKSETLLGLTLLHGREKALDLALQYGKRGMQETEAMRDDWLNSLVRVATGIAYAAYGKDREAVEVFRDCVERLSLCGDSFGVVTCQLWLSFLAYRNKQWELFVPAVTQAMSLMQSGEYHFLLQRPTMLTLQDVQQLMPVLIEAERRQVYPDYVSQLLNDLGLQNVTFHPGYTLRIQTLGQFRVWLGDHELSEKAWQRGTAKLLFQLLLTKRQHLLAREEIMNRLWADSDEESAIRDFKVALNALNKALEPNRAARADTFFIQRQGSSYGFNLASGYQIDVEEFEKLVTLGMTETDSRQAAILLEKGLSYYQGDYLPECRYDEWCVEERERLQVLFLRGAERVAKIRLEDNRLEGVIRWCEAILRVDDCWEEAYRLLMTAYYQLNNRAQAIRWYEKCVTKLQEQLGVAPMPATKETYQKIMTR